MNMFAGLSIGIVIMSVVGGVMAQSANSGKEVVQPVKAPDQPAKDPEKPARDHAWLKQFVGEWEMTSQMYFEPGQPPAEAKGTDSVRGLGNHWIIADTKTSAMGTPYSGVQSLGYDQSKNQFQGTWIDSFGGTLWVFAGSLNGAGDTLTLEAEGPSMQAEGKSAKYKYVIQITGIDSRTFNAFTQTEDGKWMTIVTNEYRRKK